MAYKVCFVHTVCGLTDVFRELCREYIPDASLCHIIDESLIQGVLAAGGLTPVIYRRVCEQVIAAEQAGAGVVQITCSSVSPCVDIAEQLVSVPVLKIDEAMVEQAVDCFTNIGVIATAPTTLRPTRDLVEKKAALAGQPVEIQAVLCKGAYEAFRAGKLDEHDQIVRSELLYLTEKVEVVLLAQASMARVAGTLREDEKVVPILSSPRPAIERLASVLAEDEAGSDLTPN